MAPRLASRPIVRRNGGGRIEELSADPAALQRIWKLPNHLDDTFGEELCPFLELVGLGSHPPEQGTPRAGASSKLDLQIALNSQ